MMSRAAKDFELIDHTADVGIIAHGASLGEVFANAGRALFSLITETATVKESLSREIEVSAANEESLLVEWLNELVYLFDTENILFKRFEITAIDALKLKALGYGEKVDKARHPLKVGVKAATYHLLSVGRDEAGGYRAQVIFDI